MRYSAVCYRGGDIKARQLSMSDRVYLFLLELTKRIFTIVDAQISVS